MSLQTMQVGLELLLCAHRRFGVKAPKPIVDDCWQQPHYELAAPEFIPTGCHYQDQVFDGVETLILPMQGVVDRFGVEPKEGVKS